MLNIHYDSQHTDDERRHRLYAGDIYVFSPSASSKAFCAFTREMIEEANRNELLVIKEMREAAAIADEHDDPGTVDVFSRFVQIHEKHEWWLRDMLRKNDGLCN